MTFYQLMHGALEAEAVRTEPDSTELMCRVMQRIRSSTDPPGERAGPAPPPDPETE